jgi:hypothetical protein
MSTCTGLAALDHANTKFHEGYDETGKGAGLCARHEILLRNALVTLQIGERWVVDDPFLKMSGCFANMSPLSSAFANTYPHLLQNIKILIYVI